MARSIQHRIRIIEEDSMFTRDICGEDEALQQVAGDLFKHHKAAGTIILYQQVQRDFKKFCEKMEGLSYTRMSKVDVGRFVLDCKVQSKNYAYWGKLKASLEDLERQRDIEKDRTALSPGVLVWIEGGKREAAKRRPMVRKMKNLDPRAIAKGLNRDVWPYCPDRIQDIDLMKFRTLYRWAVLRQTAGRFTDFDELQAKHFSLSEDKEKIRIIFPMTKGDQLANGTLKYLPKKEGSIDPFLLTLIYFKRCGFRMSKKDESFINCRVKQDEDGKHVPIPTERLAVSNARAQAKSLLEELGFSTELYGETSTKRAGVTEAMENGNTMEELQHIGGWKTAGMPAWYAACNEKYKIKLVKNMKIM